METAALLRTALLRNVLSVLEQPLDPRRTAAISQQLAENGLLTPGPDAIQGGVWAPVTELQGKFVEKLLKHLAKGEVRLGRQPCPERAPQRLPRLLPRGGLLCTFDVS